MIVWIGMLLWHFGVSSILGKNFRDSLEDLQPELGVGGNPLDESFGVQGHLGMDFLA